MQASLDVRTFRFGKLVFFCGLEKLETLKDI